MKQLFLLLFLLNLTACYTTNIVPYGADESQIMLAEKNQGYDDIGLASHCKTYLNAPRLPLLSTVMGAFGNPLPCIDRAIPKFQLKKVQIDLIDCTAQRNNKELPGAKRCGDLAETLRRATEVNKYAIKYPKTKFELTGGLEHDIKDSLRVEAMCGAALKGCPLCTCINSPYSGVRPASLKLELHGTKVRAWSVSGDGASMLDGDNKDSDGNNFNHSKSGSDSTYGWVNSFNNRCTGEEYFVYPLERTHRPILQEYDQIVRTFRVEEVKPNKPAICKSVRDIAKPEINKPNAENYCNGQGNEDDKRGLKNLLILKKQGAQWEKADIYSASGKKVGCFYMYGKYTEPGLNRWYQGNCSGLYPTELMDALGSEWGFVRFKDGNCVRFNSIRREGIYR